MNFESAYTFQDDRLDRVFQPTKADDQISQNCKLPPNTTTFDKILI